MRNHPPIRMEQQRRPIPEHDRNAVVAVRVLGVGDDAHDFPACDASFTDDLPRHQARGGDARGRGGREGGHGCFAFFSGGRFGSSASRYRVTAIENTRVIEGVIGCRLQKARTRRINAGSNLKFACVNAAASDRFLPISDNGTSMQIILTS